jgi:hypothetical protein
MPAHQRVNGKEGRNESPNKLHQGCAQNPGELTLGKTIVRLKNHKEDVVVAPLSDPMPPPSSGRI